MHKNGKQKALICFIRWKRRPWAAFASMGKVIMIGVLCVTYSLLVMNTQPLAAQTKSANETLVQLEELVINTERPTPFQPLVRVVAVIQQQEIERAPVQNIQDLLRYIQGTDLRSRGTEGVQADINILGGTFDQTIVMINGVNYTDPQTGHHSLNIPVDISQIERIEILQGPGAWSEGSAAFAGAINIITKTPLKGTLAASLTGGSFGFFRGSANVGLASETLSGRWNVAGQVGGAYSKGDGYSDNTDFEIINAYSNLTASNKTGHSVNIQAGYQQKAFGANSFYSIAYPDQFEKTRLFLSSATYMWESKRVQLSASAYQRRHYDRFELFRYESPQWYTGHNYHMNDIAGVNAKAAFRWNKGGTTIAGAEYRFEHIYSTVLGDLMQSPRPAPFEEGINYTKSKERETFSYYLKHILQLERWRFTAGIMASNGYSATRIYAGLAAAYQITPNLEANGWVNNSYRNPTFTDLYYKSPTQTGNMNLKPEEAISAQIGLRLTKLNLRAAVSGFYRYGYSIIDWTRETGSDQWSAGNLTNVATTGFEVNVNYSISQSIFKKVSISYAWLDVTKEIGNLHSLYATDFLRHKILAGLDHKIVSKLEARWDISFQKREGTYLGPGNSEVAYKPFILADFKLLWSGKSITPFIEITNLFNTEYLYIGNLPQPGRWVKCGINVTL